MKTISNDINTLLFQRRTSQENAQRELIRIRLNSLA